MKHESPGELNYYPYLKVGRTINFSKKSGLNFDVGACFSAYDDPHVLPLQYYALAMSERKSDKELLKTETLYLPKSSMKALLDNPAI